MKRSFQVITTILLLSSNFQLFAQKSKQPPLDTSIYNQQTITFHGKKYNGFLTRNGFQLLNSTNKVFLTHSGDYFTWEFKDFNNDGYKDIYLDKGGNIPERFDLLLYVPTTKSFKQIVDFEYFPAAERIGSTNHFYSYHKSGCADNNWDSDLFYIKDFKAIRLGNISGLECANSGMKDGLYIYKIRGKKRELFKTFPIDTIHKLQNDKWGFIKKYWTENYKNFL